MPYGFRETEFNVLGGETDQNPTRIGLTKDKVKRMVTAQNVYSPRDNPFTLKTLPGFSKKNTSALGSATASITGATWLSELADVNILSASDPGVDHSIYDGSDDSEIASPGTDFTIGEDNLIDWTIFTDGAAAMAIACSLQRDTPQRINASKARADFSIASTTLPQFTDVLAARLMMGAPSVSGTVHDDRVYWSDLRNGDGITSISTQFESFEKRLKGRVRGIKSFSDVLVVGDIHHAFFLPPTPGGAEAFGEPQAVAMGLDEGPVGHHSMILADQKLWWRGSNGIYSLSAPNERVKEWTPHLRSTFLDFDHADDEFTRAAHWPQEGYVVFALNGNGSSVRNKMVGVNYLTGEVKIWTRERNAMWNALTAGVPVAYGGGNDGDWYQEFIGSTGNADDAGGAIDADIISDRHRLVSGTALFGGLKVRFNQQGSEAVTVQYRLNDDSSFTSFADSPYSVKGTAGVFDEKYFPLMKAGRAIQFRFRDANSGEAIHILGYTVVWKPLTPGLVGLSG